jgi:hypothetical protein
MTKKTDRPEDRLKDILGGTDEDGLPCVKVATLRRFHGYLAAHLTLPFEGRLFSPIGSHRDTKSPLTVVRLLDPIREYAPEERYGLLCKAVQHEERIELPLDRIDVEESSPHCQLLEDYRHWLRNEQW